VSVEVTAVKGGGELKAFIDLPFRLHANHPQWVPPLKLERRIFLNRRLNAFFSHGEAEYFLARRDGRVLGRITAHVNHAFNDYQQKNWGWFGFLEFAEDAEVLEALLAAADADRFEYAPHDENDPVSMCYTSGTTGRPKGVVYSHRSTVLHTLIGCLGENWRLRSADVLLPVTPMFHANCWGLPYAAVMMGAKIVFPGPHLHPDDVLDLMRAEPPTLAIGVPKPASASSSAPKQKAIMITSTRWSLDTELNARRRTAKSPVCSVMWKIHSALVTIHMIGNKPNAAPSTPASIACPNGIL